MTAGAHDVDGSAELLARAAAVADEVLSHPDHSTGLDHPELTVTGLTRPAVGMVRVSGVLSRIDDAAAWARPNVAVRLALPDGTGGTVSRVYTVRRFTQVDGVGTIEIDIVVHPGPAPAMSWIERVRPGDRVPLTGPRPHLVPDATGVAPLLLFADSSAVPAVHAILEQWPAGQPAHAVLAVDHPTHVDELPRRADVTVEVVASGPDALVSAFHRLATAGHSVWAAGERAEMRELRRRALHDLAIPAGRLRVFGYWRRGVSGTELDARRVLHFKSLLDAGRGIDDVDDFDIAD